MGFPNGMLNRLPRLNGAVLGVKIRPFNREPHNKFQHSSKMSPQAWASTRWWPVSC